MTVKLSHEINSGFTKCFSFANNACETKRSNRAIRSANVFNAFTHHAIFSCACWSRVNSKLRKSSFACNICTSRFSRYGEEYLCPHFSVFLRIISNFPSHSSFFIFHSSLIFESFSSKIEMSLFVTSRKYH